MAGRDHGFCTDETIPGNTASRKSPVLKTLHVLPPPPGYGRENGPFVVPSMPSGVNGRVRFSIARADMATLPRVLPVKPANANA